MSDETFGLDLIEIFSSLTDIPLTYSDRTEALARVTRLGQQALGSHACVLTFLDGEKRELSYVACAGFDPEFEEAMVGRTIDMSRARHLDFDLFARGEVVERHGLQEDGQGLADPEVARRYGLRSVLSHPLQFGGRLVGHFSHFSATGRPFTESEKYLLAIFARQAVNTIERFERHRSFYGSLDILRDVAQSLPALTPEEFIRQVPGRACALLSVQTCVVRKLDEEGTGLRVIAATDDIDDAFKELEVRRDDEGVQTLIQIQKAGQLLDVTKPSQRYRHPEAAAARGWASLLTTPLLVGTELVGSLDVYTRAPRHFDDWELQFFETFAGYTALAIHKADLLSENEKVVTSQQRLEKLNVLMQAMPEILDPDELLKFLLDEALKLAGTDRGWVSRLDVKTGKLLFVEVRGSPRRLRQLHFGEGFTGKSLEEGRPIRADDVKQHEHADAYEEFWPDTASELAIPLIINNAQVRVGRKVELASKPIGVLNLESRRPAAFSQTDEDALWPLAQQAALLIERLETDRKLAALRGIERQFFGVRNWDAVVQVVLRGITDTLGFEFVNISLVNHELNRIKTEHLFGIPEKEAEEFKRLASHPLDSDDIQAHIVRSREIEVPGPDDPRFDENIFKRFGHEKMTRVFIPMIVPSDDRVIGTVEAGYQTRHRKYIYERDVQILQGFVDYAVEALEHKRSGLLDRISHEFRAPIVGIRSNASFLQRRGRDISSELTEAKFNDVLLDCDILLYQVAELEYILGRPLPISKPVKTLVYRDIIIKTINQLKPVVAEYGFEIKKIEYNPADSTRIVLYVDRAKLSQVVYNLLMNSIKYAEDDPSLFTVRLAVEETRDAFIVKFKDWGIGVREEQKERVFEEGFRTEEAKLKNVNGSGLGLTIARKIMGEMGGKLILANHRKPTEFHMVLPKSLKGVR